MGSTPAGVTTSAAATPTDDGGAGRCSHAVTLRGAAARAGPPRSPRHAGAPAATGTRSRADRSDMTAAAEGGGINFRLLTRSLYRIGEFRRRVRPIAAECEAARLREGRCYDTANSSNVQRFGIIANLCGVGTLERTLGSPGERGWVGGWWGIKPLPTYIYPPTHPIHPSTPPSTHLSSHPSISPSIHPFIHSSIHSSIRPSQHYTASCQNNRAKLWIIVSWHSQYSDLSVFSIQCSW